MERKIKLLDKNGITANIPFILSGLAFAALNITSVPKITFGVCIAAVTVAASLFFDFSFKKIKNQLSVLTAAAALIISAVYAAAYLIIAHAVIGFGYLSAKGLLFLLLCVLLGTAASYSVTAVLEKLSLACFNAQPEKAAQKPLKQNGRYFLLVFLTASITILACSTSSPLYPINIWFDSNCFLTIGRSMLHGLMPYRDLFEQKGPLLYLLHALAALISESSFLGVYFLEVISCACFLFISYKIIKLFNSRASILWIPVVAAAVFSTTSFSFGDSAEEFCLPLIACSIYWGFKAVADNKLPGVPESIGIGITSACVLWIKFNLLGFYIGWFIFFAAFALKSIKTADLFKTVALIASGIAIVSAPILIYFAANNALKELFTVYFYDNLFLYSSVSTGGKLKSNIIGWCYGAVMAVRYNTYAVALSAITLFAFLKNKKRNEFWLFACSFIFLFIFIFIGIKRFLYYPFIFSIFTPVGIGILSSALNQMPKIDIKRKNTIHAAVCAILLIFTFTSAENIRFIKLGKDDMPQYKFADIINQQDDPTLLNYGFLDGGFYTAAGIIPNCRYFCKLNIPHDEMNRTLNEYVEQKAVDFIVTRNKELDSSNYSKVAEETFEYVSGNQVFKHTFRLYRCVDLD